MSKTPQRVLEANKRWRERNPEKLRQAVARWRANNPEKVDEYVAMYLERKREENRERKLAREEAERKNKTAVFIPMDKQKAVTDWAMEQGHAITKSVRKIHGWGVFVQFENHEAADACVGIFGGELM